MKYFIKFNLLRIKKLGLRLLLFIIGLIALPIVAITMWIIHPKECFNRMKEAYKKGELI